MRIIRQPLDRPRVVCYTVRLAVPCIPCSVVHPYVYIHGQAQRKPKIVKSSRRNEPCKKRNNESFL